MTSSSLTDQQRQDLTIFAGGDADEATASRAQLLLVENTQALEYFQTMHDLIAKLDADLTRDAAPPPSERLTQEHVRELADQIRSRARRRTWIHRPWALAAAIALVVVSTAAVTHLVSKSRKTVTAYAFPTGFGLGKRTEPRTLRIRPSETFTTADEVGMIILPGQTEIIVAPRSSLRYRPGEVDLLSGQCDVRASNFVVVANPTSLRIAGEAVVSVTPQGGSFVEVHSGTATIQDRPVQVVREGQRADLHPTEVMTVPLATPFWLHYGRERRQDMKEDARRGVRAP